MMGGRDAMHDGVKKNKTTVLGQVQYLYAHASADLAQNAVALFHRESAQKGTGFRRTNGKSKGPVAKKRNVLVYYGRGVKNGVPINCKFKERGADVDTVDSLRSHAPKNPHSSTTHRIFHKPHRFKLKTSPKGYGVWVIRELTVQYFVGVMWVCR